MAAVAAMLMPLTVTTGQRAEEDWMQYTAWLKPAVTGRSLAFSPDGRFLAVTTEGFGQVGLYRVADGKWVRFLAGHRQSVSSVAFSPDGQLLASGSEDDSIKLWRVSDGSLVRTLSGHTRDVFSVAFSPDGQLLASGSDDETIRIWQVSDGSLVRTLTEPNLLPMSVAFSPDGQFLVSGGGDVQLWRISDGSLVQTFVGHTGIVFSVCVSPDGQTVASAGYDATIRLWQVSDGSLVRTLSGHTRDVFSVAFSPDGQLLASGSEDSTVKLWQVSTGSLVRTLTGHLGSVVAVAFSPDGQRLASSGSYPDNQVLLWQVSDGSRVGEIEPVWGSRSVAFSPDGQLLASGNLHHVIHLWRSADGGLVRTLGGHTDGIYSIAFSPNGQLLASGSSDKTIKVWDVSDGSVLRTFSGHTEEVRAVAFSPDGQLLASGSADETIRLWKASDGSLVRTISGISGGVISVCFSPDGQLLASARGDATVQVWHLADGSLVRSLDGSLAVAFSPDGQLLATGGYDGKIRLWRVSDGNLVRLLDGDFAILSSLAFSPEGNFLAWGSQDGTVEVGGVSDGAIIQRLQAGDWSPVSVAFAPDGQLLASGGNGGVVVWRVELGGMNQPPSVPALLAPADGTTVTTSPFHLRLSADDPEGGRLRYKVELLQNGQVVNTFDQTRDAAGWDKAHYASGETATLTISQLSPGTYRWRAYAFDGANWSPVSEVRTFTFTPTIQWTFDEPLGDVVQIPIFRLQAAIAGLPSTERLQYRIEVSRDSQFQEGVLAFDQSADPTMWSHEEYAPDEPAGFVAHYAFPLYTPLYWRARVKRLGESSWSEPSPFQTFQVMRGFSCVALRQVRVGRTEQIPVTVTNPYHEPIDLVLAAEMFLNTDEFTGTARVIAPDGTVLDEIPLGQERKYMDTFLRDLPPGVHTYTVQVEVRDSRGRGDPDQRLVPLLGFALEVMASWAISFIIERACEAVTREVLGREGFSPVEVDGEVDRIKGAAQGEVVEHGTKRAIQELEKRGAGKLLRKFAEKYSPITVVLGGIEDCVEGIRKAFGGDGDGEDIPIVRSWDPNMKMGVLGREGFIQAGEPLPYRILFENVPPPPPALPAPAQEVRITDRLDEPLDLSTFTFTSVGFGNHAPPIPPGTRALTADVNLRPDRNLVVQIRGSLDEATRTVTVTFRGIDPDTGQLHPDGFLPPNENPPAGEGWVAFEVGLKADVPSGTRVRNRASIQFDVNDPMDTNEIVVTVDRLPPQSRVTGITGVPSFVSKQSFSVAEPGRCTDCGVQQQGNLEVHFQASDEVSGVDVVELWASEERADSGGSRQVFIGDRAYHLRGTLAGSAEPKFRFRGKFGYHYRFYTVARDVAGNREPEPDDSDARITVGEPPTLPAGLHMVSVPVQSEEADPREVFGFEGNRWARFDPTAKSGQGDYVLYEKDPAGYTRFGEPQAVPGRSYWVRLFQPTPVQVYGNLPDETQPFAVPLKQGWNQIGNPWLEDLTWDLGALQVQLGGTMKALQELQAGEGIEPYAWRWDGSSYRLIYDNTMIPNVGHVLPAWEGAWVYAHTDCALILPPLRQHRGAGSTSSRAPGQGWTMRLCARTDAGHGEAVLGVAPQGRGLAVGPPPDPPTEAGGVKVRVLKEGVPLAMEVREGSAGKQEWEVVVHWGPKPEARRGQPGEVVLTFDGAGRVPREVSLWLVDSVTGRRLSLRTQSAYRFVAREGETQRRFRIIAEPGRGNPLQITALQVAPMRGPERGAQITFQLNRSADTEVNLLTLTSRLVSPVERGRSRAAGLHQVVWTGRDTAGRPVPPGVYLVEVIARDEEGQQVRAVRTVKVP